MAWTPIASMADASSAAENLRTARGIVRFANAAEQTAAETNTTLAFPTGGWAYRADSGDLIQRSATGWETLLNLPDVLAIGKPTVVFYDSTGATEQGTLSVVKIGAGNWRLTAQTEGAATFFNVEHRTDGRLEIKAQTTNGLQLVANTATNPSKLVLTDTAAEIVGNTSLAIQSPIIALSALSDTAAPTISIGGAAVAANRMLGTDASGNLASLAIPSGGPAWLPATLGMAGQGLVVDDGGTTLIWSDNIGSGGGGTPLESFFTPSLPAATRSAVGETQINIAAGTLADDHPFSVSSNGIVVAAGTEDFAATLDYVLDIHPTAWLTPGTGANQGPRSGGNRLFIDVYWKKDGTIIQDTRISHYIRGDEDWAPGDHKIHGNFSEILGPGTYTLWINRTVAAASGNEITGYEVVAANSDIHIVSGTGPAVAGAVLRDVLTQTTYASATAGPHANSSANVTLPAGFGDRNNFVYVIAADASGNYGNALISTALLASLTGSNYIVVGDIETGNNDGTVLYRPSDRALHVTVRTHSPRNVYVGLIGAATGSGGGSETFIGLTDTPDAYTAGQFLAMTATGVRGVAAPSRVPADDSLTPAMLMADTQAERQGFYNRLQFPYHETITDNSFVVTAGVRTTPGLTGFITSPVTGSINGRTSALNVTIGGTTYQISALYQVTVAGGTQNNIVLRISPDPASDISAEWQLQIGSLLFDFSQATTATDGGGRVSYSWSGNRAGLMVGGQSYNCGLRVPIVEKFAVLPISFTQITGTNDPTQFRDNSITYGRAIGATLGDQAGWRTKAGFAALVNAGNRYLAYQNNQVVQAEVDIYDLANVVPTANLVAPADNQIAIWTTSGLDSVATLGRNHLPPGTATGQVLEWDGTAWQLISTPSGGTGGVSTFAGLSGRFTWAQGPAVSAVDNGKIVGVTGGTLQLYEPALSGFGSGNLPMTRVSGNLSALRVTFTGLTTNQQNAIKTALNITSGASATIAFGAVGTPELDLYTTGSTASTFTYDPEKQANFRHALGVTGVSGYNRYRATLVAGTTGAGDIGFSAASPMVGTLTAATGFTGRNLTIAGNAVRIEGILYGDTGGDDYVQLYLTGTITETPNLILKINGHDLASGDTSNSASDNSYGAAGWLLEWDNVPDDLMVSGTSYTVEVDAGLEAEIDSIIDDLRTLPANPTTTEKKVLAANNAGAAYETLSLDGADEASFLLNVTAVNRPNQNTTIIPLSGSGVSAYFTRSGNYLTARKAGWSHVAITVYPGAANTGQVKIHARVSNRDVLRSDRTVEHYRDVISWIFPYNFAVGDTLSFWYEARDVPAASSASSVPATPTITVAEDDANYRDTITISSPSTGLFNYIEISKRVHGAGTTQWTDWETIPARISTIRLSRLAGAETDYRIRLGNSAGVGRFRQWLAGGGTTTTEESTSAYGQTVNFNGNLHISRPSITIS